MTREDTIVFAGPGVMAEAMAAGLIPRPTTKVQRKAAG